MNIPKRRKSKDNPYTLGINNEGKYFVSFKDANNYEVCIEVSYLIFKTLNEFELKDLSQLNEFDRHIEHLDLMENDEILYKRILKEELSIEEIVDIKLSKEKLIFAINKLSINQKARIIKYYFDGKTESDIALEENVTQQSVHIGLKRAIKKLREILKSSEK